MTYMDKLPTVISCCFCCFLRAGNVMIALFSFFAGLIFAPNVSHMSGFWKMEQVLSNYSNATETAIQMTLGIVSIMLCVASMFLLIGALCNLPRLIELYQWCAVIYSGTVFIMFSILAVCCFFIYTNCYLAGGLLCALMFSNLLLTTYFVLVANSLRMSLIFMSSTELML